MEGEDSDRGSLVTGHLQLHVCTRAQLRARMYAHVPSRGARAHTQVRRAIVVVEKGLLGHAQLTIDKEVAFTIVIHSGNDGKNGSENAEYVIERTQDNPAPIDPRI